ncbi:MAG: TetR/AcrR family transcriptional regulator [Gammaproteobacteria bacterium]|nr:MAG: TetR/AcrR family transcriptional regulator [Gammaproteobacteria bacterium]
MARVREFDPAEALDQAVNLFWERGFGDTSMEDLVASTGVSRYGIYSTFGNKRELFIAALQRYAEHISRNYHAGLFAPEATRADIEEFMTGAVARSGGADGHRGCMICTTAVEVAPDDAAIAAAIRELFDRLAAAFATAIANSQAAGDIDPGLDSKATGELLVGVMQGAHVMARSGISKTRLTAYMNSALQLLA